MVCKQYKRGYRVELEVRKILEKKGYYIVRSAGSKGLFDLIAINQNKILLLQIKVQKTSQRIKEIDEIKNLLVPLYCKKQIWLWKPIERQWKIINL